VINGGFAQCTGICVGNSESTLYFTTTHLDRIVQWDMSTPGDVTTGGRVASDDIDVSGETTTPAGITLNSDGTKIYIGDSGSTTIYQYDLTTGFDGSTASYSSVSYDCGLTVRALTVEPDGTKLFISHTSGMDRHSFSSGGTDEIQRITASGSPSEGTFTLTYSGQTTSALDYDSTAAEVDTALEALSNIDAGDVTCSGGPLPGSVVDVTFTGNLAATNVDAMTVDYDGLLRLVTTTTGGINASDELVTLTTDVPPGTGTFTLTFGGQTTANLNWNATAAQVQSKLAALSTIGDGNVSCTGGPINSAAVKVKFVGTLAKQDVGAITASSSMTQTSPVMSVTITTDGNSGVNELQLITVEKVSGGTFTLNSDADTTTSLSFDATASEVQAELEALSDVGNGNVLVTGGPLTEAAFNVEFIGSLGNTDVSTLGTGTASLLNGGWASGANKITYTDVEIPDSTSVTRRQILRTKPGDANVFYIDIDEADVISNTFSSTNTDDDLKSDVAVVMIDSNGVDTNLSRHGVPPNYKRVVTSYQNRLFYGVDYVERSMVTISGDTATGVATDWPGVFDSRTLYDDTGKAIVDVDANQQTATLSESTTTEQDALRATIRQGGDDSQRIYHSALTAIEALPESVHPNQSFLISRSDRDGDMAGQFNFDGQNYVAFQSAIYRYSYSVDPASAPDGDGRMQLIIPRGVCNNRTVAFTDDLAFCVDREGAYLLDGDTLESVSGPIKPMFSGRGGTRINWKHQDNFHAAYFGTERTVRFFVTLDGGPYPRHALCWNVDQRFWWIEKFAYPIVSSTTGVLDGKSVVFLGSTGRRVFTMTGTREALGRNVPGSLRGTATSADTLSITDAAATFPSSLLGSTVTIVSGTGRGQTRRIVEVAATKLTVHEEWGAQPSDDSVYQLAAVNWSAKTGKMRFEQSNEKELRRLEMFWEPLSNASSLDYQLYLDFQSSAVNNERTLTAEDSDGIATTEGTPYNSVDLTKRGHVEQDFGGMRQEGVSGDKFLTIEVEGSTNDEQLRLLGIAVSGAE
jgi:sugar lactone lactonase YvrE